MRIHKPTWLLPLLLVLFMIYGAGAGITGLWRLQSARTSVNWPSVPGKILESAVEKSVQTSGRPPRDQKLYHARIRYEFSVDGAVHHSTRISYGDYGSGNPGHAQTRVERYPAGSRVQVFYQPGNPSECCLETGVSWTAWLMPIVGAVFFMVSLGGLTRLRRRANLASSLPPQRGLPARRKS
jgi:hypothetical protein